jgi:hypothetical protein
MVESRKGSRGEGDDSQRQTGMRGAVANLNSEREDGTDQ